MEITISMQMPRGKSWVAPFSKIVSKHVYEMMKEEEECLFFILYFSSVRFESLMLMPSFVIVICRIASEFRYRTANNMKWYCTKVADSILWENVCTCQKLSGIFVALCLSMVASWKIRGETWRKFHNYINRVAIFFSLLLLWVRDVR